MDMGSLYSITKMVSSTLRHVHTMFQKVYAHFKKEKYTFTNSEEVDI
jgi:hypothetical protein